MLFSSTLQCQKELGQIIARTPLVLFKGSLRVGRILFKEDISLVFRA